MHAVEPRNEHAYGRLSPPPLMTDGAGRVALCHHDGRFREEIRRGLAAEGMEVITVSDPVSLLELISERSFRIVIASLNPRPDEDGGPDALQVLQMCRAAGLSTPFIVLSDRPEPRVFNTVTRLSAAASLRSPVAITDLVRLVAELDRARPRNHGGFAPLLGRRGGEA